MFPTNPTFEEIKQMYEFMLRHEKCRIEGNAINIGSDQYNRCYAIKPEKGCIATTYKVTCLWCNKHEFVLDMDSI